MSVEAPRKLSVASSDVSEIDQSCAFDTECGKSDVGNFMGPIDDILALVQNAFDKRVKISAKDMQFVGQRAHEMKNKIINKLILTEKENTAKETEKTIHNDGEFPRMNYDSAWPSVQRSNRGKTYASVIVKSDKDEKFETSGVRLMESKVNKMLSSENIEATIISSSSTKNGDCVIKFNEKDDVNCIARKMEDNWGIKAQSRPIFSPKMTISYVPKYISLGESVTERIVKSNKWLEELIKSGECFEVLFTYEVKDWGSIVCRVSPRIRAEIMFNGNMIKVENRSCPIKDRFHVLQCGNCLGFGHKTKVCRKETITCTHCAEGHKWKDCPHKEQKNKLCCSNCQAASSEAGDASHGSSTNHDVRSRKCPVYQRHLQRQIDRTSWSPGPTPTI